MEKPPYSINLGGQLLSLEIPKIMGILNVTPDSFYDGGAFTSAQRTIDRCGQMIAEGATIIDIGGVSTRPGATEVSESEELDRVLPRLEQLSKIYPTAFFSVDTFRANVAETAVRYGAHIINDISSGELDAEMVPTIAGFAYRTWLCI